MPLTNLGILKQMDGGKEITGSAELLVERLKERFSLKLQPSPTSSLVTAPNMFLKTSGKLLGNYSNTIFINT
jgi:hypothetical protein